jgi:hypothetical protein
MMANEHTRVPVVGSAQHGTELVFGDLAMESAFVHIVMETGHKYWSNLSLLIISICGLQISLSVEAAQEIDVPGALDFDFLRLRLAVSSDVD